MLENLSMFCSYLSHIWAILLDPLQDLGILEKCTMPDILPDRIPEPGPGLGVSRSYNLPCICGILGLSWL